MARFPSSRDYFPGDGTLPDGPLVGVHLYGQWRDTMVRLQQWGTPIGEEHDELARDWWCFAQTAGHPLRVRANDLDWGDPDPALPWLAALCGVTVEEAAEPVSWP